MLPSRRGSAAGTLPKGRGCHATASVADSVASCHGPERPPEEGCGRRVHRCHGSATELAAKRATAVATARTLAVWR